MAVVIVGQTLSDDDAVGRLRRYPRRTPHHYDLPPCFPGFVTREEIERTRRLSSRISNAEAAWFIERSRDWDWSRIQPGADLKRADPEVVGQLYDEAVRMYRHFASAKPRKVNIGKISKVLHLKYPQLIPILDTRLRRTYSPAARAAAKRSPRWCHDVRRLYWAAIRDDLLRSDFIALRDMLRSDAALAAFAQLSDVRLLDALAW